MSSNWLCFQFNAPERKRLLPAFFQNENWSIVKAVMISFKSAPNSNRYADAALSTSRKSPSSHYGRVAKFCFYKWQYNWIYHKLLRSKVDYVACFNGLKGVDSLVVAASRELNIPVLFFEIAPLSNRIQIDWKGINFDSSIPRNVEFYRNLSSEYLQQDWRNDLPVARSKIRNPNVKQLKGASHGLSSEKYIFCPLQTPMDSQLTVHGGWIKDMHHYIDCINRLTSYISDDLHFRIKEHPSSRVSFTEDILKIQSSKLVLDNETDTMDLVGNSQCVMTINSTVGLEAFHFGKPVITLGKAFYSFGDLTCRAENFLHLTELIQNFEHSRNAESDRDLFMRFLYYWFPSVDNILNGEFTLEELNYRSNWLKNAV